MDLVLLKEIIITIHALGAILGLGGAYFTHFFTVSNFRTGNIIFSPYYTILIKRCHHFIWLGLVILWLSAGMIVLYYYYFQPEGLWNAKMYGKTLLVLILTLFSMSVSRFTIPLLTRSYGKQYIDLSPSEQYILAFQSENSFFLWTYLFILGSIRSLNFTATSVSELILVASYYVIPYIIALFFLIPLASYIPRFIKDHSE